MERWGIWNAVVWELAGPDFDRAQKVALWPLDSLLHAYLQLMREAAAERYRYEMTIWAALAPHVKKSAGYAQPKPPRILSGASVDASP